MIECGGRPGGTHGDDAMGALFCAPFLYGQDSSELTLEVAVKEELLLKKRYLLENVILDGCERNHHQGSSSVPTFWYIASYIVSHTHRERERERERERDLCLTIVIKSVLCKLEMPQSNMISRN